MKAHITQSTPNYRDVEFEVRHSDSVAFFEYKEATGETHLTSMLHCWEELPEWMVENMDKSVQLPGNSDLHLMKQACQDELNNVRAYHMEQLSLAEADKRLHSMLQSDRI